ncbi:hypothetical protein ACFX16_035450 [Malus domestica]
MFRQTYLGSQFGESREKSHALDQTFLLPIGDGDLRKKTPMVHDSTHDPLVLQLLKEAWSSYKEDPRHPLQAKTKKKLGLQLYTGKDDSIEHLNLFESTMAYRMHTDEERCLLFPSTLSGGALNCRFSHEYSRCAEADDNIALKAFTAGLRECLST